MTSKGKSMNWFVFASSCLTRILFWATTAYILYICIDNGYSLLVLHVAGYTIGCGFLMIEATLVVTGDALLAAKCSKTTRVRLHWILHTFGIAALIVGFVAIEISKIRNNQNHFTSDHGKVGLTGTISGVVVGILAIPTLHRRMVPKFINFGSFKRTHVYVGIIAMILLWAGQITGFHTRWWSFRTSDLITDLHISAYVIGGFFLLVRPLYLTLSMSFNPDA